MAKIRDQYLVSILNNDGWRTLNEEYIYLALDKNTTLRIIPSTTKINRCKIELIWHDKKYYKFKLDSAMNKINIYITIKHLLKALDKRKDKEVKLPINNMENLQSIFNIVK